MSDVLIDLDRRIVFIRNEIAKGGSGYEPALMLYTNVRHYIIESQIEIAQLKEKLAETEALRQIEFRAYTRRNLANDF